MDLEKNKRFLIFYFLFICKTTRTSIIILKKIKNNLIHNHPYSYKMIELIWVDLDLLK